MLLRRGVAVVLLATTATLTVGVAPAGATRKLPDRTSLQQMAKFYRCDLLATPGRDYYPKHGGIAQSWLLDLSRRTPLYLIFDPADVGWEPGPNLRRIIIGACAREATYGQAK